MFNDSSVGNGSSAYVKVPNYPALYRHARSGRYYGFKKVNGKRHERSLKTADRKIAEHRLRDRVRNLEVVDAGSEKTTLPELIHKLATANQGKSHRSQCHL